MTITAQLLAVYRVDQQLQGLEGRLQAAERFYQEQTRQLDQLKSQRSAGEGQLKHLQATSGEQESEVAQLESRIETLRERMNSASTNKEYKALLAEIDTLKAQKEGIEEAVLEQLTKIDELKNKLEQISTDHGDREKVQKVAANDRDKKEDEIKDRVEELRAERIKLAGEVPPDKLKKYDLLYGLLGEEAMAPLGIQDRRRHEYTCGTCMMNVPMETANALLRGGVLTTCVSCGCILYLDQETAERLQPANSKR